MDPDQAAAAGFQHDDLGDTTTYADGGGSSDESWGRALLRRGWDLSRKAAIAGVAAAAAPVVAPQLVILSVAGLALSLPFAAYLASFAATERLMSALLPPPRDQPYHAAWDLDDDDEFLDASEAPGGEAHVFDYWSEAEDGGIVEEDERYPSLPLSREPRLTEEPVLPLSDEEGALSEGKFRFQELGGHEPFLSDNRAHKEDDDEYITMEALPPRGIDDSRSAAPELWEEDDMVTRIEEAPVAAEEPVQELSASDNGDKTEDGKRTATEETESSKEMVSSGTDIGTAEVSGFPVPILGKDDTVVQREGEREDLDRKSGQQSQVSDAGEKTEEMPPQEVNVPESSVPVEMEGNVTMEMVLEEVTIDTDPVTEEVVGVQIEAIATQLPECEPLHLSDLVAQESQEMAEAAYVDDVLESTLTEDVVMDIGDVSTEGVEHNAVGDVTSVVSSVVTVDDVANPASSMGTPNVLTISDDTMNAESRPDVEHSNQTTGVELTNKGFWKKELVEDKSAKTEESKSMDGKVPTRSMAPQDIDVSKSQVPNDDSKREDEVTVEMVLEVTSTSDLVTEEVVGVQVDIIASESESLPLSDLVAQELQTVTGPAAIDSIQVQRNTVRGDIVTDVDDTNTEGVELHSEGGASSFISGASVVTLDEAEDLMSSRRKPYVSAIGEGMANVEGRPDVEHPHESTGFEYKLMNEGPKRNILGEVKDNYTEEQLREQLDTLRTITGYCPATSLTLEAELTGLYMFVGVEPLVSSRDAADLTEINAKLQFLKSIIGVE